MEIIVGTAGHIDHGKTALVKALTGVDADRLPEEKRRGITVDLGFAEMKTVDVHLGFVDVPGHERFVKNMLAGASGIDLVMLVIEAGEGVMPQTREHFDICRLLGIKAGIVVITKTDLADTETIELAKLDAAELVAGSFLEGAPVVAVGARTGNGIDELNKAIGEICKRLPAREDHMVVRLPIDRSFSMKGFGAVVTGTLASGVLSEGGELELLPAGTRVRVRGLQTHGKTVGSAGAGQRVAVNLGGIDHTRITRGMVLSETDVLLPTQIIDAAVEVLPDAAKPLRSRQRVRVHIGTIEALARIHVLNDMAEIAPGKKDFVQIRLETAVTAVPGERFILRSYSPQATIAGGEVIDSMPVKHRSKDLARVRRYLNDMLAATDNYAAKLRLLIAAAGPAGFSFSDMQARTGLKKELLTFAMNGAIASGDIVDAGGRYVLAGEIGTLLSNTEAAIGKFHKLEPLARGISREALREQVFSHLPAEVFQYVVASLASSGKAVADKETIRLASHASNLSPAETELREKIAALYQHAGLEVPKLDEALGQAIAGTRFTAADARKYFQLFLDSGELVKVTDEFYFTRRAIDGLSGLLRQFAAASSDRLIDVAKFKEMAGISRKYAIPLFEYFDRVHVTSRAGDKRLIL